MERTGAKEGKSAAVEEETAAAEGRPAKPRSHLPVWAAWPAMRDRPPPEGGYWTPQRAAAYERGRFSEAFSGPDEAGA